MGAICHRNAPADRVKTPIKISGWASKQLGRLGGVQRTRFMQQFIVVVHLMIVLAMIGVVLLQKSEGGALGIGSTGGFMSSRGSANVLTRTTGMLAAAFFGTSLILSILAGLHRNPTTIIQSGSGAPTAPAPGAPAAPLGQPGGSGGGLLDALQKREQAPSGPQVPQP
jgi:preprotein translocase subunit SecG